MKDLRFTELLELIQQLEPEQKQCIKELLEHGNRTNIPVIQGFQVLYSSTLHPSHNAFAVSVHRGILTYQI